jgi:hypothetical protein
LYRQCHTQSGFLHTDFNRQGAAGNGILAGQPGDPVYGMVKESILSADAG